MEQLLVAGITVGCIYALIALSFAPAFSSSNVVNFGQGELVMLGSMLGVGFVGTYHLSYWLALVPAMLIVALVSLAMYLFVIRVMRQRGAGLIVQILGTLAAGILVRSAASFIWGLEARRLPGPFRPTPLEVLGFRISAQTFVIVGAVVVVLAVTWYLYTQTLAGLMIRATALRRDIAQLMGINVERLTALTFLFSGALAGLAGMLYGPFVNASPWSGLQYALWGFVALIIGGLGSWAGPVIAGVLLGVIEIFARARFGVGVGEGLSLVLLFTVLYIRPTGLMGSPDTVDHTA